MPVLVLDKSALKAAPAGKLTEIRSSFDFLLTGVLLHEIATERLDERDDLSPDEAKRLDGMIEANFRKARDEAGNLWIDNESALNWEISEGVSARYAPPYPLPDGLRILQALTPWVKLASLEQDLRRGKLTGVPPSPKDIANVDRISKMGEEELFATIQRDYSLFEVQRTIAEDARRSFTEKAASRGVMVSPDFAPNRDWFSFGIMLALRAFLPWKFWKKREGPPDPKKPANPFYDMNYVGYLAIADGVLSSDKTLLKFAWALWPEKRDSLRYYDMDARFDILFEPEWTS